MRKCFAARSALWSVLALSSFSHAAIFNTSWIAPGGAGSWGVASNWSGGLVPQNGTPAAVDTFNVFIDNGQAGASTVTLNTSATISNLSISAGDRLNIPQARLLTLSGGTITNVGTLLGTGTDATASGLVCTGTTTLTGGGTVVLGYTGVGLQFGGIRGNNASTDRLVNVNNFITGTGLVGNGSLVIINSGTIAATVPAGTFGTEQLTVFTADTPFLNNGTLISRNGGDLRLLGFGAAFTFNNSTGNIISDASTLTMDGCLVNGGNVRVIGAGTITGPAGMQISNGTITNSSTGVVERVLLFNTATLSNPAGGKILGSLTFDRSIAGTFPRINNAGEISMVQNNQQIFHVGGTVTFAGGGSVNFPFAGNSYVARLNLNPTFDYPTVINQDHTFLGQGTFGAFSGGTVTSGVGLNLINAAGGTFDANIPGGVMSLRSGFDDINYPAATITNNGTMKSRLGGTLWFEAGAFLNNSTIRIDSTGGTSGFRMGNANYGSFAAANLTGGTILFTGAGTALIASNSNFTAGTLISSAGTQIQIANGTSTLGGRLMNPGGATIAVSNAARLVLANAASLTNSGVIFLNSSGTFTDLRIGSASQSLSGGGSVTMSANANNRIYGHGGAGTERLVNIDHLITGGGQLGFNLMGLSNLVGGTIEANAAMLVVDPSSLGVINAGVMRAVNGGTLALQSGTFDNTNGTLRVDSTAAASTLSISSGTINSGSIHLTGANGANLVLSSAFLNNVLFNAGSVSTILSNAGTNTLLATVGSYSLGPATVTLASGSVLSVPSPTFVFSSGRFLVNSGSTFALASNSVFNSSGTFVIASGATQNVGTGVAFTSSNTVTIDGTFSQSTPTVSLRFVNGSGTLTQAASSLTTTASHLRVGTLNIGVNGLVSMNSGGGTIGTSRVGTFTIGAGGRLDLNDHDLVVDYTAGSPATAIRAQLISGYAAGSWTGNGIRSSSAAATASAPIKTALGYAEASALFSSFPATFSGQSVDNSTLLIAYTLYGDANLDRAVNITDFARLAANFNIATARWDLGDFNYDGTTNISDFSLLAANFNQTLPIDLPRQSVPEPAMIGVVALLLCSLKRAQRRES